MQANASAEALAEDHPNEAQEVREWNATTRRAMIAVLDQALKERHADRQTELWRMTKSSREVTCAAVYTRVGLDLRLLERDEMLRTELFHDGPSLQARSQCMHSLERTDWQVLTATESGSRAHPNRFRGLRGGAMDDVSVVPHVSPSVGAPLRRRRSLTD